MRHMFTHAYGFDHEVVGSGGQAFHDIPLFAAVGHEQEGNAHLPIAWGRLRTASSSRRGVRVRCVSTWCLGACLRTRSRPGGLGKRDPAAPMRLAACLAPNRRIEVVIRELAKS